MYKNTIVAGKFNIISGFVRETGHLLCLPHVISFGNWPPHTGQTLLAGSVKRLFLGYHRTGNI